MDKTTRFMVFCIEEYRKAEKLSGKQVMFLFNKYGVLDYITSYYEALHTTGTKYIIEDINLYIDARKAIVQPPQLGNKNSAATCPIGIYPTPNKSFTQTGTVFIRWSSDSGRKNPVKLRAFLRNERIDSPDSRIHLSCIQVFSHYRIATGHFGSRDYPRIPEIYLKIFFMDYLSWISSLSNLYREGDLPALDDARLSNSSAVLEELAPPAILDK